MRHRLFTVLLPLAIAVAVIMASIMVLGVWNHGRVCGELSEQYSAVLSHREAVSPSSQGFDEVYGFEEKYAKECLSRVPFRLAN